jgi:F0F1-type ATP synthase gamma subunit
VDAHPDGKESQLIIIGEKGRAQLVRDRKDSIVATIQEVGKLRMTFAQARI